MDQRSRLPREESSNKNQPEPHDPARRASQLAHISAVNEALLVAGLREHELREKAENLATELRREMEQRLHSDNLVRASEIRFRRLFETAESGILVLDADSLLVTDANPFFCKLVGYSRAELVGKKLFQVAPFPDLGPIQAIFQELRVSRQSRNEDLVLQTKSQRNIRVGFAANRYDEGGAGVIQCNVRDLTEQYRLLQVAQAASSAAESANSTKDLFLAALSHELRTPLNPVLLLASDGALNQKLPPEVRQDFASIEKNILMEARLIEELLDFTKIARGKLSLHNEAVAVNHILDDAIANIQAEIDAKALTLSVTKKGEPLIKGDPLRLQQVFWNVLRNAVKFTAKGGRISVQSSLDASRNVVTVEISDSGIGMDPSEMTRIFDPFKQGDLGDKITRHKYGGLGLGLSIARNIVELHFGVISAKSDGIGFGSIFTIELPLSSSGAAVIQSDQEVREAIPRNSATHRLRALIVEDNEESRIALTRLLVARDMDVSSARSFGEALQIGSQQAFDILIADIGLPDGNGLDLLEQCGRKSPQIKGIAISGYGMKSDIDRSKAAKFSAHLVKPVGIGALENALQITIKSKKETS